jgi:hypothetical protein
LPKWSLSSSPETVLVREPALETITKSAHWVHIGELFITD